MTAAMIEAKPVEKPVLVKAEPQHRLAPNRLKLAEHERRAYVVTPEHGQPFSALLKPDYWTHIAAKLRPYDLIEARAEDGTWFAYLLVMDAGPLHATVFPLNKWDLIPVEPAAGSEVGFVPKWRGPHSKWAVMRLSDNKVMAENLGTRYAADDWIMNYRKALSA